MNQSHQDLSVVVQYRGKDYKILENFLTSNLHFFQENGLEILIIFSQKEILPLISSYIERFPFFNWKLIYANLRNELEIYEVGVKFCSFNWLIFINATYILKPNTFSDFLKLRFYYSVSTIIGQAISADMNIHRNPYRDYPVILFLTSNVLATTFKHYKDANASLLTIADLIRFLEHNGSTTMVMKNTFEVINDSQNMLAYGENYRQALIKPTCYYTYQKKKHLYKAALDYFQTFKDYHLKSEQLFNKKFNILAVASIYNEKKHLKDFLANLAQNCDAIIILDDGSDDGGYEEALEDKVILKVKKLRNGFNDLDNRNILLKLSFFFNANWLLFMDADERITNKFESIESLTHQKDASVYLLNFVNLWDSDELFRQDMEGARNHNAHGIYKRHRLFKNIGYTQIKLGDNRKLHFATVPYLNNCRNTKVLIYHLGILNFSERLKKYNFYKQNDLGITRNNYDYLLDRQIKLKHINSINPKDFD